MSKLSLYAIVPAAGLGRRMGCAGNKAWLDLGGRSVLECTLDLLYGEPRLQGLVLVGRPSELEQLHALARRYSPEPLIVSGGETRQDSVRHGLEALAATLTPQERRAARVLIHDAARCLATPALIDRVATALLQEETVALTTAVPVTDTIAEVTDDSTLVAVPPRRLMRQIQTPQGFRLAEGLVWHQAAAREGRSYTDDSALALASGARVLVIEGESENFKLTLPEDYDRARTVLARRASLNP
ncbi:MAG: 2-C-methyl-D-erythritol 4-phosphate cytidylyltransferase [Bacillota bacterium]|nr:2-C-methyl-D-erythritol 4-phosphate cytidylyltransferase [Bacillota bacterium]